MDITMEMAFFSLLYLIVSAAFGVAAYKTEQRIKLVVQARKEKEQHWIN